MQNEKKYYFYIRTKEMIMEIAGYKQVTYNILQKRMAEKRDGVTNLQLAVKLRLESPQTIKNAFQLDRQKVSDKVLTSLIETIGINACVIWEKGVRNYYVKR